MTGDDQRASQTLHRAIDIIDAVAEGCGAPAELAARLGLSRSTAYRLSTLLAERGYLELGQRGAYHLGARMFALGQSAARAVDMPRLAQPILDELARATGDAANLGVRDDEEIIYLAQSPGTRRLTVRHRVGDRNTLRDTALGQALLQGGPGFHRDEFGDGVVCVAAPVRDASGAVVAAISLSTIPQYLAEGRLEQVERLVVEAARTLSGALGAGD